MTNRMGLPWASVQCLSLIFLLAGLAGLLHFDLCSVLQTDTARDDHLLPGLRAAQNLDLPIAANTGRNLVLMRHGIGTHHHERGTAFVAGQERFKRYNNCILNCFGGDSNVDGAARTETLTWIGSLHPNFDCGALWIQCRADQRNLALRL